jgi:replicative DNA helicase
MKDFANLPDSELVALAEFMDNPQLWIEACLRNPLTNEPLRFNYVQRKFFSTKRKNKVLRIHRRAGKSWLLASYAIWYAFTHASRQVMIICPDSSKVETIFNAIDDFIRVSPGIAQSVHERQKTPARRKFTNGSLIAGFTTGARSNSKGESVRSKSADVVIIDEAAYLREEDWAAILPIMTGDSERVGKVICLISSTPTSERGHYYMYCTKDFSDIKESQRWDQIHVSVFDNPDFDEDARATIRAMHTEEELRQEWEAEFPDVGEGVFKRSYIDRAGRAFYYYDADKQETIPKTAIRTMGVDWDKVQAGPNIVVLELDPKAEFYRVCYREEIPRTEYSLTIAVERIIELNTIFNPSYIYVDRGYAEQAVETLHLHGAKHPDTGLAKKVRGVSFSENVEVMDPFTGEAVKKRIKPYMVNILVKWFEDNSIVYPASDKQFITQLEEFKVVRTTDNHITYSSVNEHIIDACMLAAYAMHENYTDPFRFTPAEDSYLMPIPDVVPPAVGEAQGRAIFGPIMDRAYRAESFTTRKLPIGYGRGFTRDADAQHGTDLPTRSSF